MTAREHVRAVRRGLGAAVFIAAAGWAVAIALLARTVLAFAQAASGRAVGAGTELLVPVLLGGSTFVALLWLERGLISYRRVALWVEERAPGLEYALVTAIELGTAPKSIRSSLEAVVDRQNFRSIVRTALVRRVTPALAALAVSIALLYLAPESAFGGANGARYPGRASSDAGGVEGSRLDGLRITVIPPAYTRQSRRTLVEPATVSALAGSTAIIRGRGSASGIASRVGQSALTVTEESGTWTVRFTMPATPAPLVLRDRNFERVIVLEPRIDEAPRLLLRSPVRDTTLRVPRFSTRLEADIADDIGIASAHFELLITSGSGETYTSRTLNTPAARFGGSTGRLSSPLDVAALRLGQGDVVSIRAVAADVNTLSGPSIGMSETRTIRIARADEYDSISIEAAAPPPVDSSIISQRMLIMLTEELVRQERSLDRAEFVRRSTEIGDAEDRIRKRVYDILYETDSPEGPGDEEEPETEIRAITNKDLKDAYDALWDAVRSLQIAEPSAALPPMRLALQALDRARLAQRVYLRGTPPPIIVDLQRVRLAGKEKGSGSVRTPRAAIDSARVRMSTRLAAAMDLLERSPAAAVRELALLRVEALTQLPALAAALAGAEEAIRRGRDVTPHLLAARRAVDGAPSADPGLPVWTGG